VLLGLWTVVICPRRMPRLSWLTPTTRATQWAVGVRAQPGIVAGALYVLPRLFILIGLSWVYPLFGNVPLVARIVSVLNRRSRRWC
jgi:chromate transport protein ChrA